MSSNRELTQKAFDKALNQLKVKSTLQNSNVCADFVAVLLTLNQLYNLELNKNTLDEINSNLYKRMVATESIEEMGGFAAVLTNLRILQQ